MKQPPVLAAWILKRLTAGEPNDGLAGDLLEELRSGRSSAWYWWQVFAAVFASYRRVIAQHWTALVFAVFWSLLAPAWESLVRAGNNPDISRAVHSLGWPWSPLCGLILAISLRLAFVWSGLVLYLVVDAHSTGLFQWRRFRTGVLRSSLVFAPLWMPLHLLGDIFFAGSSHLHSRESLGTAFGPRTLLEALAFFLTTLFAIWVDQHAQTAAENASEDH